MKDVLSSESFDEGAYLFDPSLGHDVNNALTHLATDVGEVTIFCEFPSVDVVEDDFNGGGLTILPQVYPQ